VHGGKLPWSSTCEAGAFADEAFRKNCMTPPYVVLADTVAVIHFLWILFLIFGAFWGRRNRTVRIIHICGLVLAFLVETLDWFCPLTDLEVFLRRLGNGNPYPGAFIATYLNKIVYLQAPRALIVALTVLLCVVNAYLYRHRVKRG
jgi:hypothetical protein